MILKRKTIWPQLLLLSVVISFLYMRPLHSPGHPFIGGDGLGYYAYLPATFIYGDKNYEFKWFNKVHDANYKSGAFENPEDNLLVKYGDRRINKYYPGLSLIWLPFFFVAHALAHLFHQPPDGFSTPYQLCIGLASLFNLLLGLYYLRKLILRFTNDVLASVLVPAAIFFGTYLFIYGIAANSHTHAYSFTLITILLYYLHRFFHAREHATRLLIICLLVYVLLVFVRPLTGLIILATPALIPRGYSVRVHTWKATWPDIFLTVFLGFAVTFCLRIIYLQTGTLFAYTYSNERFNLADPRLSEVMFSYHVGIFVYMPLLLISLFGGLLMTRGRRIVLPLVFLAVIFLYSSWWYWPIIRRALIDFYALPALMLAVLLAKSRGIWRKLTVVTVLLSMLYFQVKSYQVRNGILDENATYKELFWDNFFVLRKTSQYPIDPRTVRSHVTEKEDFEGLFEGQVTDEKSFRGKRALLLDGAHPFSKFGEKALPWREKKEGFYKIRCSFRIYVEGEVPAVHGFIQLRDAAGVLMGENPIYLKKEDLPGDSWDLRQFGYELDVEDLDRMTGARVDFSLWNVEAKGRVFVDEATFEFFVTDRSFETIR